MLISTDGVQRQYFAVDGDQAEFRAHMRNQPWMSPDQVRAWQLRSINRGIERARRDVPFYARRLPEDPFESLAQFTALPVLTRAEVSRAGEALRSLAFDENDLIEVRTGGTTGEPLRLWCTREGLHHHYAAFARFREWIGLRDDLRVAAFGGGTTVGEGELHERAGDNARILRCAAGGIEGGSLGRYVEALLEFVPDVIDGYPSVLAPLARYIKAHDIRGIHPDAVITSGDLLTPITRRLLEEAFRAPVFDHYGSVEMVAQLTECRAGSYHVNSDYGYVEIVRDGRPAQPGETGEIVATGFFNDASPLIRYATGDLAVAGTSHCPCGRSFPTVERLLGRLDDLFVAPDGHVVGRLDQVFRGANSLMEARIVQDAPDHVTVEAVSADAFDPLEVATLMSELRMRLGPSVNADIARVARIPRTPSGRFRTVQRFGGARMITPAESRAVV